MATNSDRSRKSSARPKKRAYVRPAVKKHGSLNSQIASFRTFY